METPRNVWVVGACGIHATRAIRSALGSRKETRVSIPFMEKIGSCHFCDNRALYYFDKEN